MTKQSKSPAVYIMTSRKDGPLYTGVTGNLPKRVHEHKQETGGQFTSKYRCQILVYFELHDTMESAILREKQIKAGSRHKKLSLIHDKNPEWCDLYNSLI